MKRDNKLKGQATTRELRLRYYNDYLLKNGVITKREHARMNLAILSKCGEKQCAEHETNRKV